VSARSAAWPHNNRAVQRACHHRLETWAAQHALLLKVDAYSHEFLVCDSAGSMADPKSIVVSRRSREPV